MSSDPSTGGIDGGATKVGQADCESATQLFQPNPVYAYNTPTMEVRQLMHESLHSCTAINGNLAVWVAYPPSGTVLEKYDLQQNIGLTPLTFNPLSTPTGEVAISAEWLAWSDRLTGVPQIYIRPR